MLRRMFRGLPIAGVQNIFRTCWARSSDRAILFWGLATMPLAALAIMEGDPLAIITVALAVALLPYPTTTTKRLGLSVLGGSILVLGPIVVLVVVPTTLLIARMPGSAAA